MNHQTGSVPPNASVISTCAAILSSCLADKWVARNHDEKLLPGLGKYSQRQMFWISAANVWCAKYRDKALKLRVLTGVHSPDMFRDGDQSLRGTCQINHLMRDTYMTSALWEI